MRADHEFQNITFKLSKPCINLITVNSYCIGNQLFLYCCYSDISDSIFTNWLVLHGEPMNEFEIEKSVISFGVSVIASSTHNASTLKKLIKLRKFCMHCKQTITYTQVYIFEEISGIPIDFISFSHHW